MDSFSDLVDAETRLLAFTGKGGVGKTTASAATAVHLAKNGERTLLLSTDRSPSLSDVLELDVSGEITSVPDIDGLDAVEMDFDIITERWKKRYGEEVYAVVSSFMPVESWVVDYVAEAPGIATQFALSYILEYFEGNTYDRIVWDTAPAGSTIGLLELEEQLYAHLGEAPKFYAKLRAAIKRDVDQDPRKLLAEWRALASDCLEMVQSPQSAFVVVTIPEALAVKETHRIVTQLREKDIAVDAVIANNVLTGDVCDCEHIRQRAAIHEEHLAELATRYAEDPGLVTIPQLSTEIAGHGSLEAVAEAIFESEGLTAEPSA